MSSRFSDKSVARASDLLLFMAVTQSVTVSERVYIARSEKYTAVVIVRESLIMNDFIRVKSIKQVICIIFVLQMTTNFLSLYFFMFESNFCIHY